MRMKLGIAIAILFCVTSATFSQQVQVNRQNRTVDVTVTAKVSAIANLAEVTISCDSHAQTIDQAYQLNLGKADKVVKAMLDAGVPKGDIFSVAFQTDEIDTSEAKTKSGQAPRFIAHQTWKIRVTAADAQRIIDLAVAAGANSVERVEWTLSNPDLVEAKARAAALEKARTAASEIANTLGGKLGEVIYVSNESASTTMSDRMDLKSNVPVSMGKLPEISSPKLQLFPEKVEKEATVRVVFALD